MKLIKLIIIFLLASFLTSVTVIYLQGYSENFKNSKIDSLATINFKNEHSILQTYYNLPLQFIQNIGQVDSKVRGYARTSQYTLWVTEEGFVFDRYKPKNRKGKRLIAMAKEIMKHGHLLREREVSKLAFLNTQKSPRITPLFLTSHRVHYFKGNNPANWKTNIPTYKGMLYKNLYQNIDLKVYGTKKQMEYDWVVNPGGDPEAIRFECQNISDSSIDGKGNLTVNTRLGRIIHKRPASYQREGQVIDVSFKRISGNIFGFSVGKYDKTKPLIIDPVVLSYSTFLGGSDEDGGSDITLDNSGNIYVVGDSGSTDFPKNANTFKGETDVFVAKFSNKGKLVYSAFLGGEESEIASSITVDGTGSVYITGGTISADFPTKSAYDTSLGVLIDVFVCKLSPQGNNLLFSTYLGGSGVYDPSIYNIDLAGSIAIDAGKNVYVTGMTSSTDFPTKNSFDNNIGFVYDGFVTKLSANGKSLVYSTYLGGLFIDLSVGIHVLGDNSVIVAGTTNSSDFPALWNLPYGESDVFVAKLSADGKTVIKSVQLGGGAIDSCNALFVDTTGSIYVTGMTESSDFLTENAAYTSLKGESDAFVFKINSQMDTLLYSTYLGGSGVDEGGSIAVSSSGYAYILGTTESKNFPCTKDALDSSLGGESDCFLTRLNPSGGMDFSTYFGGSKDDEHGGITVNSSGDAYFTGTTESGNFPTKNPFDNTLGGDSDAFVSKVTFKSSSNKKAVISLSRKYLAFSASTSGAATTSQGFFINNHGTGTMEWTITDNQNWLDCSPLGGTNSGQIMATVNAAGLGQGSYTAAIKVHSVNADNSPQSVNVSLKVYNSNSTLPPFGDFATPANGSTVRGSVPVTGWVLDDVGIASVKLWRGENKNLLYIGAAVLVEGARPDVEQAYPDYPMNYKAGWGYMMLTNFLPNSGNGTFKLHAIATDAEGKQTNLGTKTIICDNANAVKPFGAIDTPAQGGTASGGDFVNWGWVLAPQPNRIPKSGATIDVWVDGVNIGHPTYNIYRQDIANLFPDYSNSNGAVGYFTIDTTTYENGVHSIQWTAKDKSGNTDGIGSRYFTIVNTGASSHAVPMAEGGIFFENISDLATDYFIPVKVIRGYHKEGSSFIANPDDEGIIKIRIEELDRVVVEFNDPLDSSSTASGPISAYSKVGNQLRKPPIGSYMDKERGVFFWQPVAGFLGTYELLFIERISSNEKYKKMVHITIEPKFSKTLE
jgi:hypothetical protein